MHKRYNITIKHNNNGITLIALILTIIVLLILAGIVINSMFVNDSIIVKAQWAKYETGFRQDEEKANLYSIRQMLGSKNNKIASLDNLQINKIIENGKKKYPVTVERYQIENASESLKGCIKYIEKIDENEEITEEYENANIEEDEEESETEDNDYEDDVISITNGNIIGYVGGESTKIYAIYIKDGKTYKADLTVIVLGEKAEIDTSSWLPQVELTVNKGKRKSIRVKNNAGRYLYNRKFNWTVVDE